MFLELISKTANFELFVLITTKMALISLRIMVIWFISYNNIISVTRKFSFSFGNQIESNGNQI